MSVGITPSLQSSYQGELIDLSEETGTWLPLLPTTAAKPMEEPAALVRKLGSFLRIKNQTLQTIVINSLIHRRKQGVCIYIYIYI